MIKIVTKQKTYGSICNNYCIDKKDKLDKFIDALKFNRHEILEISKATKEDLVALAEETSKAPPINRTYNR